MAPRNRSGLSGVYSPGTIKVIERVHIDDNLFEVCGEHCKALERKKQCIPSPAAVLEA